MIHGPRESLSRRRCRVISEKFFTSGRARTRNTAHTANLRSIDSSREEDHRKVLVGQKAKVQAHVLDTGWVALKERGEVLEIGARPTPSTRPKHHFSAARGSPRKVRERKTFESHGYTSSREENIP